MTAADRVKQVQELYLNEGLSRSEVADELRIPKSSVDKIINRHFLSRDTDNGRATVKKETDDTPKSEFTKVTYDLYEKDGKLYRKMSKDELRDQLINDLIKNK